MTITCPQCQFKNPDDAEFCENCGAQLPLPVAAGAGASPAASATPAAAHVTAASDELVCPTCKAPYAVGDVFCFNCGTDLSKLPANHPAGAAANTNQAAAPAAPAQATATSAPAQAKQPELSPDDWDKAFSAGTPIDPPAPAPAQPAPVASSTSANPAPAPAPASTANGNGFAAVEPDPDPALAGNGGFGAVPATDPAQAAGFPAAAATPDPASAPAPTAVANPTALKLHVAGPYGDEVIEYKGRELLLGRQDAKTRVFPDLNLDDGAASRRHLSIWQDTSDNQFYAQDLESSNGTSLNGRDMEPGSAMKLNNNDVIRVGTRYSIQVRIS